MIDSVLAEYQWPTNPKNAARAGFEAARRMLATPPQPSPVADEHASFIAWAGEAGYDTAHAYDTDRSRWVFWNPMTTDLWTAWNARAALASQPTAQGEPLSEEVIEKLWGDFMSAKGSGYVPDFVRAIEAAHHIGRKA